MEVARGSIGLFHVAGPLSFGSAKHVVHMLRSSTEHDVVIVDLAVVSFIDSSASIALEEIIAEMHEDGALVIYRSLQGRVHETLKRNGLLEQ
ncbi:MAG: SulP family sulfate permease [Gammaproteobacteria bacterium]|jgi:SulP family sulfate permease